MEEQARQLATAVAVFKVAGGSAAHATATVPNAIERRGQARATVVTRPRFGGNTALGVTARRLDQHRGHDRPGSFNDGPPVGAAFSQWLPG
jgi:predicted ThiF/HesA family dinucleotide-utilizing enzyme